METTSPEANRVITPEEQEVLDILATVEPDEEARRTATLATNPPISEEQLRGLVAVFHLVDHARESAPDDLALEMRAARLHLTIYHALYHHLLAEREEDGRWKYTMRQAEYWARQATGVEHAFGE
jgi:DNA-binding transcriptional ArsR family regulator